jgi:CubicO group peptidase (beta-lactamase class C family)
MPDFPRARRVVDRFIDDRVAPCAVAEAGGVDGPWWRAASGRITYGTEAPRATTETVFDLASLTKVLATATVAMRLVDASRLDLDTRVADLVPCWRGTDREAATVKDLLAHSSGLPAHRPYSDTRAGRPDFERAICAEPLEYPPGTASIYSDLGFMLLGFILEDAGRASLDAQTDAAFSRVGADAGIRFGLPADWLIRIAPTSDDPRRLGIADDRNAGALGGVAGHAGLFGTAGGVGAVARAVLAARAAEGPAGGLASHDAVARFTTREGAISSRALAWDTMLPTSSCGARMSPQAFGHTGFTGTSLWIDPAAGLYVVLLTNRVYPAPGPVDGITAFRRALHDAVFEDLESGSGG